jgi:hypothetical protein
MSNGKKVIAGYPEFWQTSHDSCPGFYDNTHALILLENEIFGQALSEPLHKVLRQVAKTIANSFGALITLALNGHGHDAVRVARSMFEGAVTARYLQLHPDRVQEYLDFYWVQKKRFYDYLVRNDPAAAGKIPAEVVDEFTKEFRAVRHRFENRKKKLREGWGRTPLSQMAEAVGMGELYDTFYRWASSIHHVDITGLLAHSDGQSLDVNVSPTLDCAREALIMGHNATITCLAVLNDEAKLGFDSRLEEAADTFKSIWKVDGAL